MQIRLTYPSDAINADTIARALEASASVAESQLDQVPSIYDAIRSGRVVWRPEPRGQGYESFDLPLQCYRRGWGDCDDLVPWLLAELRASGEDPEATAAAYESGDKKWHCIVQRSDGSIDDPSRWAGMGRGRQPYDVPRDRPLIAPGQSGMVVGEASPGCYVCRFDLACDPYDDAGLSVRRSDVSPIAAVENAAKSSFHVAVQANMDPKIIKQLWGLIAALRGHDSDYIQRHTGLDSAEQGHLTPMVIRALDLAEEYDVSGDGILSTIFDPLGIHHVFDPLLQSAVQSMQQPTRPGQVTYQPAPGLTNFLSSIIGANVGACATTAQLAAMSPHQRAFATPCKTKAAGPPGRGSRAPGAQRSGTPNTSSRGGTTNNANPQNMRPAAVDPSTRPGAQQAPRPIRGQARQQQAALFQQMLQDQGLAPYDDGTYATDDGGGGDYDSSDDDWPSDDWDDD